MSEDEELNLLKRRRLLEMQRRYLEQQSKAKADAEAPKKPEVSVEPEKILKDIFVGRAWEVWDAAKSQYPQVVGEIGKAIVAASQSGKLKEKISGEQLHWLFQRLGFPVRLQTHIRILESGEVKSIAQKLKEG
jgi:DNA-binding TFAR19-related protein (PDSD5 family)